MMAPTSRAAWVILTLACVAVVVVFVPAATKLGYDRFAIPKELLVCAAPLVAAVLLVRDAARLRLDAVAACLLGFLAISVVGLVQASNPSLAWRALGVSAGGVAAFLVSRHLATQGYRRALLFAVAGAAVVGAATVLLEAHALIPALSQQGRAPGGTEGNRNFMAHMLVSVLPLMVVASARARPAQRRAALVALVVVVMAVVLSRSRAAWLGGMTAVIASAGGLALVRPARLRDRLRPLAPPLLACAVAALSAVALPNQLTWTSARPYAETLAALGSYQEGTGRGRLVQYRTTARVVAAAPLVGVGPGNWSIAYPAFARGDDPSYRSRSIQPVNRLPNSDWLGVAAERGVLGLVSLLAAGAVILWRCGRRLRTDRDGGADRAVACAASLATVFVVGLFDAVLLRPTPLLLLAVLVGALCPALPAVSVSSRWLGRAAGAGLAMILILFGLKLFPVAEATAQRRAYYQRGDLHSLERAASATPDDFRLQMILSLRHLRADRCERAVEHAERALAFHPHLALAHQVTARCGRLARHPPE